MIAVHSMHARPSLDLCIHAVDNKVVSFLNTIKRNMIAAWTCDIPVPGIPVLVHTLFLLMNYKYKSFTEKSLT
jgi:hypothetical protein